MLVLVWCCGGGFKVFCLVFVLVMWGVSGKCGCFYWLSGLHCGLGVCQNGVTGEGAEATKPVTFLDNLIVCELITMFVLVSHVLQW